MDIGSRSITVPRFLKVRRGILAEAGAIVAAHDTAFERPLIITDRRNAGYAIDVLRKSWPSASIHVIRDNSLEECREIAQGPALKQADSIIGVGGGRALDVGKYVATNRTCRYVSIPTVPSHDGLASPVSVLKDETGHSQSLGVQMPIGVLVDLDLLRKAPRQSILAGTGDMISNLSAIEDWLLAERDIGEQVDDYALLISSQSAQMVLRYLEKEPTIESEAYLEVLVEGLILSGIAMNIAGNSRPASGAEHEISHAIDALFPEKARLHGYQVAFGTLVAQKIRGKEITELTRLFSTIGLPVGFKDLGLTIDEAVSALFHAPETRPGRYSVLKKRNLTRAECRDILMSL
jgi:glycerol-1-phosphate dehydrogenase [NAD(P)+]